MNPSKVYRHDFFSLARYHKIIFSITEKDSVSVWLCCRLKILMRISPAIYIIYHLCTNLWNIMSLHFQPYWLLVSFLSPFNLESTSSLKSTSDERKVGVVVRYSNTFWGMKIYIMKIIPISSEEYSFRNI